MCVTETLRILLTIFLSTVSIQNVRLFGVYDVRWPFLAEIHTAPLKRFVPSSVLQAVRALRNAPAALAVFLAGVAPVVFSLGQSVAVTVPIMPNQFVVNMNYHPIQVHHHAITEFDNKNTDLILIKRIDWNRPQSHPFSFIFNPFWTRISEIGNHY